MTEVMKFPPLQVENCSNTAEKTNSQFTQDQRNTNQNKGIQFYTDQISHNNINV